MRSDTDTAGTQRRGAFTRLRAFEPATYREPLLAILREIDALIATSEPGMPLPAGEIDRVLRRHPKNGSGVFSRGELVAGFRALAADAAAESDIAALVAAVRMRPVRTQSGVAPVTVLTKPFPCPGTCVFCPNDVRMPKSYLAREPGCQRAVQNDFDPYLQTYNRLLAFDALGHAVGKVEIIVLGGTWSFYPEAYRLWFIKRCFDALNDLGQGVDRRAEVQRSDELPVAFDTAPASELTYNHRVSRSLVARHGAAGVDTREHATWDELARVQRDNEQSGCRNVGLVIETRPDRIDASETECLRRLGCTKVQIGYQSLSDEVLVQNRRGHDVAATRRAMKLLRAAGFKIHAHWMPNLLGSTPEADILDFKRIFDDADFRPDELKVYPCSLVESAELMEYYERGQWRAYTHDELLGVLSTVLTSTPRYCRLSRVIRDISSEDIVTGNRLSNFREVAEQSVARTGAQCSEIRSREIKHIGFAREHLALRATVYATAVGDEHFLEFVTAEDRVVAFLRLSLPNMSAPIAEIAESAMVRELHVYGGALALHARAPSRPQHQGLGRRLMEEAAARARHAGYGDLAVISAVGTRPYYRKLGFQDGALYQHLRNP